MHRLKPSATSESKYEMAFAHKIWLADSTAKPALACTYEYYFAYANEVLEPLFVIKHTKKNLVLALENPKCARGANTTKGTALTDILFQGPGGHEVTSELVRISSPPPKHFAYRILK